MHAGEIDHRAALPAVGIRTRHKLLLFLFIRNLMDMIDRKEFHMVYFDRFGQFQQIALIFCQFTGRKVQRDVQMVSFQNFFRFLPASGIG